jgi:RsiW-degrading membrane proteinase PrsW (M82 family)
MADRAVGGDRSGAHPHAAPEAPVGARHAAAIVIAGIVLAGLAVSFLLSVNVPVPRGLRFLLGVPPVVLIALETFLTARGLRDPSAWRRRRLLRSLAALVAAVAFWLVAIDAYLFSRAAGPATAAAALLLCLPTTAFGLWFVRRLDRNEKEPWRLMLVSAAWGGIVATSLASGFEKAWIGDSSSALIPGPGVAISVAFSAGLFEELGKGVAVLLLFLVMRDEFDDVVDGIVYGAAVGLGFNFVESVGYITSAYAAAGLPGAADEWIGRQVLNLFFGHATFTALVGAGIGVARQTRRAPLAGALIASGWLAAIAAHFAFDLLHLLGLSTSAFTTWPFTAVVTVLLVLGLRAEGRALARHLLAESSEHPDVVAPAEVWSLLDPSRRFKARVTALRERGPAAYARRGRLQAAQLELALARWHRERGEADAEVEWAWRRRVLRLRQPSA